MLYSSKKEKYLVKITFSCHRACSGNYRNGKISCKSEHKIRTMLRSGKYILLPLDRRTERIMLYACRNTGLLHSNKIKEWFYAGLD